MPKLLTLLQRPVRLCVVEFDPSQGEEIFLTYTHDRRQGPRIVRTGIGPPFMARINSRDPGAITTQPFGQRLGTWLIQEDLRQADLAAAQAELQRLQQSGASQADIDVLMDYLTEGQLLGAHDTEFSRVYPNHEIIGQQGCGDLTMNLWNVAYVNSPLARPQPALIHLFEEPLGSRTYSCLVKWQPGSGPARSPRYELTIEDVRFAFPATVSLQQASNMIFTWNGTQWMPRDNDIEFAVYGKQVVLDGKLVNISRITHEFSDLRHLVQMPNLNPDAPLFMGDPGRPRFYFGRPQYADVWFGEAQLLDDSNLQRLACLGPLFMSRLYRGMGASVEQVQGAMQRDGYREVTEPRRDLEMGEYRFVAGDDTLVEVSLKRNTYGWTMLGLP